MLTGPWCPLVHYTLPTSLLPGQISRNILCRPRPDVSHVTIINEWMRLVHPDTGLARRLCQSLYAPSETPWFTPGAKITLSRRRHQHCRQNDDIDMIKQTRKTVLTCIGVKEKLVAKYGPDGMYLNRVNLTVIKTSLDTAIETWNEYRQRHIDGLPIQLPETPTQQTEQDLIAPHNHWICRGSTSRGSNTIATFIGSLDIFEPHDIKHTDRRSIFTDAQLDAIEARAIGTINAVVVNALLGIVRCRFTEDDCFTMYADTSYLAVVDKKELTRIWSSMSKSRDMSFLVTNKTTAVDRDIPFALMRAAFSEMTAFINMFQDSPTLNIVRSLCKMIHVDMIVC